MKLTWNFYSGLVAPVMILIAIIVLFLFSVDQSEFSLYFFPFILLGVVMANVLLFWSAYMLYIRKMTSKRTVVKIGNVSKILGKLYFFVLIAVTALKFISIFAPIHFFGFKADNIYWMVSAWTFIEITHHYFYKLIYDKKQAFFEIVNDENVKNLRLPSGGSIGIAVKKLQK